MTHMTDMTDMTHISMEGTSARAHVWGQLRECVMVCHASWGGEPLPPNHKRRMK